MIKLALAALAVAMLTSLSTVPAAAGERPNDESGSDGSDSSVPEHACEDELGYLRPVSQGEVLGIELEHRVWVTEVCPHADSIHFDGNAAYVRSAIGENDVLVRALRTKGFFSDDVFAVVMMGDDAINLYVHRFGGR